MKAGIVLGIHGSLEGILAKAGGNAEKVSEMMLIRKYSERFEEVFVFSHDSKSYGSMMPDNCRHVRLRNRPLYLAFGWLVLLFFIARQKIGVLRLVGASSLPVLFVTGWVTRPRIVMKYYYLWHRTAGRASRGFMRAAEKVLLSAVDDVIACNSEVAMFIGKKGKIMDVKEGIITEQFDPVKIRADEKVGRMKGTKLIFVGRLVSIKDPLTLLRGYLKAKAHVPGLTLIVCGDGPLMNECRKLSDGDVHFLGFVGNVPSLMKSCDIHVMTSLYDASPRSLMEAMCMGIPSIATNVGGIPEYLTERCGILVEPGSPDAVAGAIVRLAKDRHLRKLGRK